LHRDLGQAFIAADAMLHVHDEIAGREGGELLEEGVGILAALGAADQPVAEHVLLGEDGNIGRGEAVIERQDDQRDAAVCDTQRLLPAVHGDGAGQAMVFEQALQSLAGTVRIAGKDRFLARFP
jgi:hypothetical protein